MFKLLSFQPQPVHCPPPLLPPLHLKHESISSKGKTKSWAALGIWKRSTAFKRSLRFHNKNGKEDSWLTFSVVFINSLPSYFSSSFIIPHLPFSILNGKWSSICSVKQVVEMVIGITCSRRQPRFSILRSQNSLDIQIHTLATNYKHTWKKQSSVAYNLPSGSRTKYRQTQLFLGPPYLLNSISL